MSSLTKVACISLHIIVLFYLPCFYPYCSRSGTFFNKFLNILQPLQQHSLFTVIIKETRQFELLNYSEHGTIVDNVLYSCDFSEKPKQHSNNTSLHQMPNSTPPQSTWTCNNTGVRNRPSGVPPVVWERSLSQERATVEPVRLV